MKIRKTSLAALLAAMPALCAAAPLMNGPAMQSGPALSTLLGELAARRADRL
ncbi:hypothetical protein LP420_03890 [Massilia sp. B-10]|nr:hypothetical protein LP420_03890 [Massilia sp. B-10]